ncbi:MAG TPA: hypothetical protein VNG91_02990 [Terriglobia bacterium]|nr:hypothetical protein [Terriglobia bacterium]
MSLTKKVGIFCAIWIGVSACAWAQFMQRGGPHPPSMPGMFKPVVGSGAQYQMTSKGDTIDFSYSVVGKEQVCSDEGYWLEIRSKSGKMPGEMVMKQLMVMNASHPEIKRMIMQPPGRPPMEMPVGMMEMMRQHAHSGQEADSSGPGKKIGEETITVPAGTFECEHYRKQENDMPIDYWISTKISPYGLVKMTSDNMTMVLEKSLTGETSHIQGEPQKMDMPHF